MCSADRLYGIEMVVTAGDSGAMFLQCTDEVCTGNMKTNERRDTPRFAFHTHGLYLPLKVCAAHLQKPCHAQGGVVFLTKHLNSLVVLGCSAARGGLEVMHKLGAQQVLWLSLSSKCEMCNRSKYSVSLIRVKCDISGTCLRYILLEAQWGSESTEGLR
jgi:hypothetical protein